MYLVVLVIGKIIFGLHSTGVRSGALIKRKSIMKYGVTEHNQKTAFGKIGAAAFWHGYCR